MSERLTAIRESILKEMDRMIVAGHCSGSQSAIPECFLPENMRYTKYDFIPPPSAEEVVCILNELIKEEKLRFDQLQVIKGKIYVRLIVP